MSGGVISAYDGDPGAPVMAPREAADTRPVSWWSQVGASFRVGRDDIPGALEDEKTAAYGTLIEALTNAGMPANRYVAARRSGDPINADQVWQDIADAQRRDPRAFKGLTREGFERDWQQKLRDRQAKDAGIVAGSGTVPWLLGSFAAGLTDPINAAGMLIGAGEATTAAKIIARETVTNAGIEAFEQPLVNQQRRAEGRPELTAEERLTSIGVAGLVGGGMGGLMHGAGKAIEWSNTELDARYPGRVERRMADALRQSVKGDWALTPEQSAALHILDRAADVDESNPYRLTYSALDAHTSRIQSVLSQMEAAPRPAPPKAPAPVRPSPGGSIDSRIVSFFRAKGYSEAQARGIAAGIHAESGSNPMARNPSSGAMGIGQWLGDRQRKLRQRFGDNPTLEQQLEYLHTELQGGDRGGAAVLRQSSETAVLDAYINHFMRPAKGMETSGDLSRGMAALGRAGEQVEAATDVDPLLIRPDALDAVRPQLVVGGREIPLQQFAPHEIGVDAALMQFKSGGDQFGVTDRLRGIERWDPLSAGTVTVWEGLDGRRLIADGHQRLGLARRIMAADPGQDIKLNAFVLREADGYTAAEARTLTALQNIRQGSGKAADAAKVFREVGLDPDVLKSLPPRSSLIRDGKALASLSDEAFGAIINEVIPEGYGAAIGALAPDPATHMALVDLLAKTDPPNRLQAEAIVRQALDVGFHAETQEELFGGRSVVSAIFQQKARLLDKTLSELRKLKGAFGVAARNADALDQAGNRIDVSASTAEAAANANAIGLVDRLALRTGNAVNDLFNRAAQRLAAGEPLAAVTRDVVADLRQLDLERALRDAGEPGGQPGGSGRAGQPDSEAEAGAGEPGSLTPAERDELEAAGQSGFTFFDQDAHAQLDDPAGPGLAEVADSVWHDVRAASEPTPVHPSTGETVDQVRERAAALRDAYPPADPQGHAGTHNLPGSTPLADGRTRADLRAEIIGKLMAEPAVQGREAHIVLGPPAAGKSSFADPLAAARGLRIIDSDAAKAMLPEFADGVGAAAVHEESAALADAARELSIRNGDNILLPLVGKTYDNVANAINGLVKQNYRVYVHLVDLPIDKAEARAVARFSETGRFVDPAYVRSVGDKPRATYDRAIAEFGSKLEGHSHVSNDVPRGEAPRFVAGSQGTGDGLGGSGAAGTQDGGRLSRGQSPGDGGPAGAGDFPPVGLDRGAAVDPNIAALQRQQAQLGAEAPLRAAAAQDGTMGSPLFDAADQPKFDLGDGKGERTIAEIEAELDADTAAIDAIKGCLL